MNIQKKKALIIGCGIAGPVVAMFLQRAGIEAEIYEARNEPADHAGSFLNMACNGLNVLEALKLENLISQQGSPIPRMIMWNGQGKRLGEVRNGARAEVGTPSVVIKRATLQKALREEAMRQGIKITFGKKLQDLQPNEQEVTTTFTDGSTASGTFLIGCDGVHSRTSRLINPNAATPQYSGLISTGGFAQRSSFSPTPDIQHFIFGKRAFFGYHVGSVSEIYWFVNFPQKAAPARGDVEMIESDKWQERMLDLFSDDLPLISDIIRATDSKIIGYPIYDIFNQPIWHRGPVVLIGDAIHAISPNAGQGASLAMEDAIVLAKCLRDIPGLAQAFATYEQLRRARVERMVQYARSLGQGKIMTNPVQIWFRDQMMPFFLKYAANPKTLDWGYAYKVNWDEPAQAAIPTKQPSLSSR